MRLAESNLAYIFPLIIVQQLIFALYHTVLEIVFGASLGKMFFQLKIVSEDGSKPTPQQVVVKGGLRFADYFLTIPLGFVSCLLSKKRQSIGDRFAKTIVVSNRL